MTVLNIEPELKENQCVYGYTNDLSKKGLFALANSLSKSFKGERLITVTNLEMIRCKNRNPIVKSYDDVPVEEKIALLKEGIDEINSIGDPRIVRTFGILLKQGFQQYASPHLGLR